MNEKVEKLFDSIRSLRSRIKAGIPKEESVYKTYNDIILAAVEAYKDESITVDVAHDDNGDPLYLMDGKEGFVPVYFNEEGKGEKSFKKLCDELYENIENYEFLKYTGMTKGINEELMQALEYSIRHPRLAGMAIEPGTDHFVIIEVCILKMIYYKGSGFFHQ